MRWRAAGLAARVRGWRSGAVAWRAGANVGAAISVALWLAAMLPLPASAVSRALLVGVSELADQPPALWLQAPRNDVQLMRDALRRHGFGAADITVLADGVDAAGLPDSAHIRDAMARLLAQSARGDVVVLYFSGHGTRARDAAKRYQEPDGLAENFLARDAQLRADAGTGSAAPLAGALRDVDFSGWIDAFLAKDVFVWSVFDTCSAASMTRGRVDADTAQESGAAAGDEVRFRGIRVDQLAAAAPGAAAAPVDIAPPAAPDVPRARYVAFFASESHQVTPELRLPRHSRTARPQGLLTWAVAESLGRQPATFRELFNGVVALYPGVIDELETRFPQRELPSPVAEGNLDAPLFANGAQPMTTAPAWPAQRTGASLALAVGALDGVALRQPLRVVATLDDGTVRSADAQLGALDLASARLPVPAALQGLPASTFWSVAPLAAPAETTLRVQTAQPLPAGLNLAYPAAIRTAGADAGADLRWTDGGGGQRIELLSPDLAAWLGSDSTPLLLPDRAALRGTLVQLARVKWLAHLSALARGGQLDGFEATLETWDGDRLLRSTPLEAAAASSGAAAMQPVLPDGARAALTVRNASGHSVDLLAVGIGAGGQLVPVYPPALDETNRFERGTPEQPAVKRFALPWLSGAGGGRLLVLATPAAPYSAPRLFGAAPRDELADVRVRGLRGLRGDSASNPADRPPAVFAAVAGWRPP